MTRRIEPHMPPPLTDWSTAKCHNDPDMHPEDFFPVQFYREGLPLPHTLYLRAYCGGCSIQAECLEDAIDKRDDWGFRGGTTPDERAAIRKKRKSGRKTQSTAYKKAPQCGTEAAYRRHIRKGEPADAACKAAHNANNAKYPGKDKKYRQRKASA